MKDRRDPARDQFSMVIMNRYKTLGPLGDGTYGSVVLGQRIDTGEKVAIKRYRKTSALLQLG